MKSRKHMIGSGNGDLFAWIIICMVLGVIGSLLPSLGEERILRMTDVKTRAHLATKIAVCEATLPRNKKCIIATEAKVVDATYSR